MRLGSKWIVAPAAGLVLLIGGIGAASAMNNSARSADVRTTATTITDDRGTRSGQDSASDQNDDRGTGSGRDSASDLNDDRGSLSGRDGGQVGGTGFERARAAALRVFPGAAVREVEHAGAASGATYHVELTQPDGTQVEVDLNANFQTVKVERSGRDG
jgi:uncharacterized membrane protein YkoI